MKNKDNIYEKMHADHMTFVYLVFYSGQNRYLDLQKFP